MPEDLSPQRFIPFRKKDLIRMCLEENRLSASDHNALLDLCALLEALLHYEFHTVLEKLKDAYAPFDPDSDTRMLKTPSPAEKDSLHQVLLREMAVLLNSANFEPIKPDELKQSMAVESLFNIRLSVDFDDFADMLFFKRGATVKKETLVSFFGLRKKSIQFVNYDRVVVYLRFKEQSYFDRRKRKRVLFDPGSTIIKLFHNVPEADLEMLFPNSEVRMKLIDKLIIGIPAAVSGLIVVISKLGASLLLIASLAAFVLGLRKDPVAVNQQHLVTLGIGLGALGGYLFKQISKFKNRKIRFMKALTENLYFRNLDNNAGVFHRLIDTAEEEEFKEMILAYYFLLTAENGMTQAELDHAIEEWLSKNYNSDINFEVDDALAKLKRFGIVKSNSDRIYALALPMAKEMLDKRWDNFFDYHYAGKAA